MMDDHSFERDLPSDLVTHVGNALLHLVDGGLAGVWGHGLLGLVALRSLSVKAGERR